MMPTEQVTEAPATPEHPEQAVETELLSRLTDVAEKARAVIEQRPVAAVLAAVAVGYVVARLVSRAGR
jgi:ElaB/YqjD/DUF883 family membrane-anchored ribosome-binding protein